MDIQVVVNEFNAPHSRQRCFDLSRTTFFGIISALVWICLLGASIASGFYAIGFMRDGHEVKHGRGAEVQALITSLLASTMFFLLLSPLGICFLVRGGKMFLAFRPA